MELPPPARPGTALRVLATTDLAGSLVPVPTSYGEGGTCAGVAELLERERERQPTVWLDAGDFTVGPAFPLLGERPWADMAELPIAAAAAGNHEFDDGGRRCWPRPPCCPTRCSAPTPTSACRPPRSSRPGPVRSASSG
jgi:2',3'-cyclic-nucleotide 2'-phosphodiesterase (5'-nucleotidase family)